MGRLIDASTVVSVQYRYCMAMALVEKNSILNIIISFR